MQSTGLAFLLISFILSYATWVSVVLYRINLCKWHKFLQLDLCFCCLKSTPKITSVSFSCVQVFIYSVSKTSIKYESEILRFSHTPINYVPNPSGGMTKAVFCASQGIHGGRSRLLTTTNNFFLLVIQFILKYRAMTITDILSLSSWQRTFLKNYI